MRRWSIPVFLGLAVVSTALLFRVLYHESVEVVRGMALQGTAIQVGTISAFRELYTTEVASVAREHGLPEMDGYQVAQAVQNDPRYGTPKIIILSSAADRKKTKELDDSGITAHLTKPVIQSALRGALDTALGDALRPAVDDVGADERVTPTWNRRRYVARVLLTEDNAINRKVASALLGKCGCDVTEAENGHVAVEMLQQKSFDMVFMDVQMPEMDGFEATRSLRAEGRTLPIIAMTAHAMKGDRERRLDAGMVDYVTKPVTLDCVREVVLKWGPNAAKTTASPSENRAEPGVAVAGTDGDRQPIDIGKALNQLGGDRELLRESLRTFAQTLSEFMAELQTAHANAGERKWKTAARGLGVAANAVCADPLRRIAQQMETSGLQFATTVSNPALAERTGHLRRIEHFPHESVGG